jgi:hypothetical protein
MKFLNVSPSLDVRRENTGFPRRRGNNFGVYSLERGDLVIVPY